MKEIVRKVGSDVHVVNYGADKIRDQPWYFSITCDSYQQGRIEGEPRTYHGYMYACGCQHDLIAKVFPELEPLIKWLLCSDEEGPMYYVANALYHAGYGEYSQENLEVFKDHVVYGSAGKWDELYPDQFMASKVADAEQGEKDLRQWLKDRHPSMMKSFHECMKKFDVTQ